MTKAVCFKCGVVKFGAFVPCPDCRAMPQTEDELALSLAMTDHYFDLAALDQMGAAVRDGKPPHLDPTTRANLIETIRSSGLPKHLTAAIDVAENAAGPDSNPPPRQKPWWKLW